MIDVYSFVFTLNGYHLIIPAFFFRKKGTLISHQSRPVVRLSVRPCVTILVNVSPPKPLDVATLNFAAE